MYAANLIDPFVFSVSLFRSLSFLSFTRMQFFLFFPFPFHSLFLMSLNPLTLFFSLLLFRSLWLSSSLFFIFFISASPFSFSLSISLAFLTLQNPSSQSFFFFSAFLFRSLLLFPFVLYCSYFAPLFSFRFIHFCNLTKAAHSISIFLLLFPPFLVRVLLLLHFLLLLLCYLFDLHLFICFPRAPYE